MKIRWAVPVLAALTFVGLAGAQTAPKGEGAKVGVLSVQAAIANTAEGKQQAALLQSKFAPQQAEMQGLQKQIDDLQTRMRTGETTLSDEEKGRITQQIDLLTRRGQREQQEYQEDTNAAEQDVIQSIGRKLLDVIEKYAKENGFSVILDISSQQTTVFWAADSVNVTQQIIQLYDSTYPVKSAATAPGPAPAPRSTTPATPKPSAGAAPKP
jgi:outer membrane protein